MKTKIIPFDLETAKKIQAREIEGRVLDRDNFEGTIITTNGVNTPMPVVIKFSFSKGDNILFFGIDGKNAKGNKLVFEVPDNEPQFKPFDKVLIKYDKGTFHPDMFLETVNIQGKHMAILISRGYCELEHMLPYEGNEHLVGTTDKPKED